MAARRVSSPPPDLAGMPRPGVVLEDASVARPALDREESAAGATRLRAVLLVGATLWVATAALDVGTDRFVEPGSLPGLLAVRGGHTLVLFGIYLRLRRAKNPTMPWLQWHNAAILVGTSIAIGLMGRYYDGITTPYAHGLSCTLVAAAVALPGRWRDVVPTHLAAALTYPATLGIIALFDARIRAQFEHAASVTVFVQHCVVIMVSAILATVGAQTQWALRRQIYESRQIGRYRLRRRLATGGMGEVWLAWHPALRHEVALKILRSNDDALSAERFEREVRATAELTHPNTVRVLDYGVTEDGLRFYAMELLRGEHLGQLVERHHGLPAARVVHLGLQAARALAEAHARGLIHRDVKPANIFVTTLGGEADMVKVLDFGLARDPQRDGAHLTRDGTVIGTPEFMAPEQARGDESDPRVDVYGLGMVLFHALSGQVPFSGKTPMATMHAHLHQPVPPLAGLAAYDLPPDLAAVVERCLAKDPRARFADAGEVAEALAACACAGTWRPARGELPQSTASTADGEDHAPTPPAAPSARAEPITGPTLTTPRRNSAGDPAS